MSERLNKAIAFAAKKHEGQFRKSELIPYILHPLEVGAIVAGIMNDENVIIAGLLHDTVEDTDTTFKEIRDNFGDTVANLVFSETEDKLEELPPEETWMIRKKESLKVLKESKDMRKKVLWLSDKLSNTRAIYRSYLKRGDDVFNDFHQKDKKKQEWYYRTIADYLKELSYSAAYQEYVELVDKIFGKGERK